MGRDVIIDSVVVDMVAPIQGTATTGSDGVSGDPSDVQVPDSAYLAADSAFDESESSLEEDELYQALLAASPHIRMDEIDRHLASLAGMGSLTEARRYLEQRRALFRP